MERVVEPMRLAGSICATVIGTSLIVAGTSDTRSSPGAADAADAAEADGKVAAEGLAAGEPVAGEPAGASELAGVGAGLPTSSGLAAGQGCAEHDDDGRQGVATREHGVLRANDPTATSDGFGPVT